MTERILEDRDPAVLGVVGAAIQRHPVSGDAITQGVHVADLQMQRDRDTAAGVRGGDSDGGYS